MGETVCQRLGRTKPVRPGSTRANGDGRIAVATRNPHANRASFAAARAIPYDVVGEWLWGLAGNHIALVQSPSAGIHVAKENTAVWLEPLLYMMITV
jgi:hypothetical protein